MRALQFALAGGAVLVAAFVTPLALNGTGALNGAGPGEMLGAASSLSASSAKTYKNCTQLNKVYPHGVARSGARDKVRGSTKPVTNFKVSTSVYNANKKSDRDKDGVACEKR